MEEAKEAFEHLLWMDPNHVEGVCGYVSVYGDYSLFRLNNIPLQLLKWHLVTCVHLSVLCTQL